MAWTVTPKQTDGFVKTDKIDISSDWFGFGWFEYGWFSGNIVDFNKWNVIAKAIDHWIKD